MHSFFQEYKDKHKGEVAYIFGSGPTLNDFVEQEPGVYLVGNNAHRDAKIREKLSYLFFLFRGYEKYYNNTSTVYGDYCQMIRDLPSLVRKFCCLNFHTKMDDPLVAKIKKEVSNVDFYSVTDSPPNKKIDITNEKLWNFSIVFGMAQFAAYAGFKKIYIVGCDCTSGYFFNKAYSGDHYHYYEPYTKRWKLMKEYMNMYYPDIEIVSVNPVGLAGIFSDVYTKQIRVMSGPSTSIPVYDSYSKVNYILDHPTNDLISKVTIEKGGWGINYNFFASRFVNKNSTIIDVGANIGSFTLPIAKRHSDCDVLSFEAQRMKSYQLAGNVYLNNLNNVIVHQLALTDAKDKELKFAIAHDSNNGSSRLESEAKQTGFTGETVVVVPAARLDDMVKNDKQVSLIKIDVEGHEENVIRGGYELIQKDKPIILFESWDHNWAKAKQIRLFHYLSSIGYDIFQVDPHEYLACHKSQNTPVFRNHLTDSLRILH